MIVARKGTPRSATATGGGRGDEPRNRNRTGVKGPKVADVFVVFGSRATWPR